MPDIKLYIACHKPVQLPAHPFIYPVHAGAACSALKYDNMLSDNTGEHISEKNNAYCELTVQYWAWKNQQADYYGFFHYRRFLSFQTTEKQMCKVCIVPDETTLHRAGYDAENLIQSIMPYDILLPYAEKTTETVYEKYAHAKHHFAEDLDLMLNIVLQTYPQYQTATEQYINGHKQYYFNMYIMQHDLFHQYCGWLFPLLSKFDAANQTEKYGADRQAQRVNGYLAERLFGIWYTYQQQNSYIRSMELPYLYFAMDDKKDYYKQYMKNKLLPPGSSRKHLVQQIIKK